MPTRHTRITQQRTNELVAQVIGLQGDPANQDTTNGGFALSTALGSENAFQYFTWSEADAATKTAVMFWSRVLLCEILQPYDTTIRFPKLVLVLRPRSHWLFDDVGDAVKDFYGNSISISNLALPGQNTITPLSPTYNLGDIIRIALLPAPVILSNWQENIYPGMNEYYPGGNTSSLSARAANIAVTGLTVDGDAYDSSRGYGSFNPTQILYYDKNVDARGRITSGSGGQTVDVNVCIGGVVHVYRLKGSLLS